MFSLRRWFHVLSLEEHIAVTSSSLGAFTSCNVNAWLNQDTKALFSSGRACVLHHRLHAEEPQRAAEKSSPQQVHRERLREGKNKTADGTALLSSASKNGRVTKEERFRRVCWQMGLMLP